MHGIILWFCRNHVAANFAMIAILVGGVVTWFSLKKEIFPETAIDAVAIMVAYPNATPEEVEKGICIPIEEAIEDVDGIERVTSSAAKGRGAVTVEVATGYDTRDVMGDVKTRVDAIDNFAENAEKPVVEELIIKAQVLSIAVMAETDERSHRQFAEMVRDRLVLEEEISQVTIAGAREYEISIEVSEETLRRYGLTFDDVAGAVRASSVDLPGGSVKTEAGEILIRTEQKRYTAEEFAGITVVSLEDGAVVRVGDIARVRDGFEEVDLANQFDGVNAILVNVFRTGDENTLDVAAAARRFVEEEAPKVFPEGVKLEIWRDDSVYLSGRMELLARNGLMGLILVFVVLAMFLRPSLAALVALGIPVSFAGAIMVMPHMGISINMISLFAFILVLGIVVDDAIVIGENVYRRMRNGEDPKTAAPEGTHEVGVVVIFGVITTMVAFTPMLGLSGVSGKIWPNIPLVVIPTLAFSLLQSKLVLPSHLSLLRVHGPETRVSALRKVQLKISRGLERFVDAVYRPVLGVALHNRYVVLAGFVGIFALTIAVVATGWLRFTFFPDVEADIISAEIELPAGVPFATTEEAVRQIESAVWELDRQYEAEHGEKVVRHVLSSVGQQPFQLSIFGAEGLPTDVNLGQVAIELYPAVGRKMSANELVAKWRELTGDVAGAVELKFQSQAAGGGNAIDLEISGNNLEDLALAAEQVKMGLAKYKGVIDIADSNRQGKRELKLGIKPEGEAMGLRVEDVARQTRQAFFGDEVQRLQRGRDEVKVMVRYPEEERNSRYFVDRMKIRTADGSEVPFETVAGAELGRSYSTIKRADRRRAVTITADIDASVEGANANEVVEGLTTEVLPGVLAQFPGVSYDFRGEQKDQRDSVRDMMFGFLSALLVMYILMAIPLASYIQPMIVMVVIPFGMVGAVAGHMVLGLDMSIMSMCGIVALAGVVVNDSLVLVDYVNRERKNGHGVVKAAWEAGAIRFRPILLTSLTTFAGLTPMLLETDIQAKFLIPMAVSLSFGILFATTITLILVPVIYLILEDIHRLLARTFLKDPGEYGKRLGGMMGEEALRAGDGRWEMGDGELGAGGWEMGSGGEAGGGREAGGRNADS